jgi:hypothetical protein
MLPAVDRHFGLFNSHSPCLPLEVHIVAFDTNDCYEPWHPEVLRINP